MYMRVAQPSETSWPPALWAVLGPVGDCPLILVERTLGQVVTRRSTQPVWGTTEPLMVIDGN